MRGSGMAENVKDLLETITTRKLALWLLLSLMLSVVFFRDLWNSPPALPSLDWVLGRQPPTPLGVSPWAVLALCLAFLWLKRKEVWQALGQERSNAFIPVGLGLTAGAVLMPSSPEFLVFRPLLSSVGIFAVIFGKGVKIPLALLAIYGFAISFPLAVERFAFAENAFTASVLNPLMWVMTTLGYPLHNDGRSIYFTSAGGENISVTVTAGCAGPASMAVFVALFALMMLDMPLSPKKAVFFFLLGAFGTWFQAFIRLVFLMLMGYHVGSKGLWTAHFWTIYILFPLWYLFFAYLYLRQVGRPGLRHIGVGRN